MLYFSFLRDSVTSLYNWRKVYITFYLYDILYNQLDTWLIATYSVL